MHGVPQSTSGDLLLTNLHSKTVVPRRDARGLDRNPIRKKKCHAASTATQSAKNMSRGLDRNPIRKILYHAASTGTQSAPGTPNLRKFLAAMKLEGTRLQSGVLGLQGHGRTHVASTGTQSAKSDFNFLEKTRAPGTPFWRQFLAAIPLLFSMNFEGKRLQSGVLGLQGRESSMTSTFLKKRNVDIIEGLPPWRPRTPSWNQFLSSKKLHRDLNDSSRELLLRSLCNFWEERNGPRVVYWASKGTNPR